MGRIAWGVLALLLASFSANKLAMAEEDKFNVDFNVGWDGCYRPQEWTPVEVGILAKLKDPLGGMLSVTASQDTMTRLTISHPIVLESEKRVDVQLVTKLAFAANEAALSIRDGKGQTRWSYTYDLWSQNPSARAVQAVQGQDMLIGVVGRRTFQLAALGEYASSHADQQGKVYVKDKLPRNLPWDWTGYASLDLLILNNPDWDAIKPEQLQAIRQWVSDGGRLLIVVGSTGLPPQNPLTQVLPVRIGQQKIVSLSTLPSPDGRPTRLSTPKDVMTYDLDLTPTTGWTSSKIAPAAIATGPVGFGRVGVLTMDPSPLTEVSAAAAAAHWTSWIESAIGNGPRRIQYSSSPISGGNSNDYSLHADATSNHTNAVLENLLSIRELRPLSIWWVMGLLGLLAVLLGPVDYLVLKKLDRLPLTWVTSACVIGLFTVGAYYGVQALRAGSMQVRVVTQIDGVQGGSTWSTSFAGIFAPSSDDYKLTGLAGKEWWAAITPAEGDYYRYGAERLAARQLYCYQKDGSSVPTSVPINIWSMQCLTREGPAVMPMKAEITPSRDGFDISVTNTSKTALVDLTTSYLGHKYSLDRLEAGATKVFQSGELQNEATPVYVQNAMPASPERNPMYSLQSFIAESYGCNKRSIAIKDYANHGAAVITAAVAPAEQSSLDFGVANKTYTTSNTVFVRLVVTTPLVAMATKDESHD